MTQATEQKTKQVRIGEYTLTRKIGQGGIAEIYRGHQESLGRDVAIKILSERFSDDPEILRRFERESIVIARLSHPNIVHVIDKGCAGHRYYFVMEFVDGTSLREVIDSEQIELKHKLDMIVQVCKALDYAHKNGVIHRDIKPANILIDREGNARVADFGIAQIVSAPEGEMTSTDIVMGTLAYMSPEQKISSANVDHTTDIYAVGVMIYEILTGQKPLGQFELPTELDTSLDPRFDLIIKKCLARKAEDRFRSAVALKDSILAIIAGNQQSRTNGYSVGSVSSFVGKCRFLDTIRESRYNSTILVENAANKQMYVIKKHSRGEAGRKEAHLLGSLKHENIIDILGTGGDRKNTVIISAYAQGGSLAERMVRPYEWQEAVEILLQIARGVDFAHKHNLVHGNIRPSNILFDESDGVKVSDFGLPVHYDMGTKKNWYAAPERKRSKLADIYAVGVIAHQLLTGRNPAYDNGGRLRLDDIQRAVPQTVLDMLQQLLAIRVTRRYQALSELMKEWEEYEKSLQIASQPVEKPAPVLEKKSTNTTLWWWVIVAASSVGVILSLLYFAGVI